MLFSKPFFKVFKIFSNHFKVSPLADSRIFSSFTCKCKIEEKNCSFQAFFEYSLQNEVLGEVKYVHSILEVQHFFFILKKVK